MKKYFLLLFMAWTSSVCAQKLIIKGNLSGLTSDTKVILSDLMQQSFHDTASVSQDAFLINCTLPGAGLYVLRIGLIGQQPEHRMLYLDKGMVEIKGTRGQLSKSEIKSTDVYMKDYLKFEQSLQNHPEFTLKKLLTDTVFMLTAKTGSYAGLFAQPEVSERFLAADRAARMKTIELAKQWLLKNPNSTINAYIIQKYLNERSELNDRKSAIAKLSPAAKKSLIGKMLLSGTYIEED